jgi:hypothetical protein
MIKLSNRLKILFEEYPGDNAWRELVSSFPDIDQEILDQFSFDPDLIRVLYWKKGNNLEGIKSWLSKPIQALDGNTPVKVANLKDGKLILRTVLMRMP